MTLGRRLVPYLAVLAVAAATVALLAIPAAALGWRLGWFPQIPSLFAGYRTSVVAGGVGLLAALTAAWLDRYRGWSSRVFVVAVAGGVVSAGMGAYLMGLAAAARARPPLYDITTDTENPPAFVAVLPERQANSRHAPDYDSKQAPLQLKTYPDIRPIAVNKPKERAFADTLAAANAMGWRIVASEAAEGRIEAVALTRWFRLVDDVTIRVREVAPGRSTVDIRSASRVGRNDLGANAARIRAFIAKLPS
jgi:uncharacterized protein (DUF1499 family)